MHIPCRTEITFLYRLISPTPDPVIPHVRKMSAYNHLLPYLIAAVFLSDHPSLPSPGPNHPT